ncbi:Metallo-hydrolase/oxidoreductase [Zalerion maritima]|uniref:Metallo-hydrolase/oxidoreductase n=1 Tax=Zalerion maritima TaxID=339359 RepID=A0AAD5WMB2_9PEZI|nr:Metallo-hydrolase/oxidoreductase [Zalerion maritima]
MVEPIVHQIFEPKTSTWQYIVADPKTKNAVVIDSVLDYDPTKNLISSESADNLLSVIAKEGYAILFVLETHVHADHLTAGKYLQNKLATIQGKKPQIGIGKRITSVQERFAGKYGISKAEWDGAFDRYFDDDENFTIGELEGKALHLPGHTPDHLGYQIGSNVFCGDSLFNTDVGSARCDFPGGDANALYNSVQKLLSLPENYRIYTGHDYPPGGDSGRKDPVPYMTVGDQLEQNKHLKKGTTEEQFVSWRKERDSGLAPPRLIHQSLQFNIRAGELPSATTGGDRLLHLPLKVEGVAW